MLRLVVMSMPVFVSAFRSRRDLLLENLALRQQLATLAPRRRPLIRTADRAFWVAVRRLWSGWADALVVVKPETVIRYAREQMRSMTRLRIERAARELGLPLPPARKVSGPAATSQPATLSAVPANSR